MRCYSTDFCIESWLNKRCFFQCAHNIALIIPQRVKCNLCLAWAQLRWIHCTQLDKSEYLLSVLTEVADRRTVIVIHMCPPCSLHRWVQLDIRSIWNIIVLGKTIPYGYSIWDPPCINETLPHNFFAYGQVQKKWPPGVTIRVKNNLFQTSFIFIHQPQ